MNIDLGPKARALALAALAAMWGAGDLAAQLPESQQAEHRWTVSFHGSGEWEDIDATSEVLWSAGAASFTATIEVAGDEGGAVRPWHVHHGTCAQGGEVVGGGAHYPALNVASGGAAAASASVPTTLDPSAQYHVNIHRSPSEMGTVIACGELTMQAD
jgi:Cu-Zn family superoxide dismutase